MNIGLVNFIDFLAILFDVGILTLYFHIFFRLQSQSKMKTIAIYIVAIIIYYWSSTCLSLAYQRTLIYLVVCLMISTCYKGSTSFKLLLTSLYVGLGVILETTVSFLIAIFAENVSLVDVGTLEEYILGLVLSSSIFFCIVCCIWFVFQKFFSKVDLSKSLGESYWNLLFFVLIVITVFISYGIYYLTIKHTIEFGGVYFFLLECLLLIFDVAIFFIFQKMEWLQREQMQSVLIMQQNEAQQAFYQESIDKNRQLKKLMHDEKNFLLGIGGYLKDNKVEDALAEIEGQVNQLISNISDYTGNIALDTVLTAKVEKAQCEGIILRPAVAIYNEVQIDFLDLVLILGNVLDNAIEAAMQVLEENKVINLSIRLQGNFLILEVKNPVKEKVKIENNNIATSKADTTMHGLGLENIKILIKKYNGAMYLQCTETTFTLKALLQNECVKNNENY